MYRTVIPNRTHKRLVFGVAYFLISGNGKVFDLKQEL